MFVLPRISRGILCEHRYSVATTSRVVPDLTILNLAGARAGFRANSFSDNRTICLKKLTVSTMSTISCYKEALQFSASFVASLFASFDEFMERQ